MYAQPKWGFIFPQEERAQLEGHPDRDGLSLPVILSPQGTGASLQAGLLCEVYICLPAWLGKRYLD